MGHYQLHPVKTQSQAMDWTLALSVSEEGQSLRMTIIEFNDEREDNYNRIQWCERGREGGRFQKHNMLRVSLIGIRRSNYYVLVTLVERPAVVLLSHLNVFYYLMGNNLADLYSLKENFAWTLIIKSSRIMVRVDPSPTTSRVMWEMKRQRNASHFVSSLRVEFWVRGDEIKCIGQKNT